MELELVPERITPIIWSRPGIEMHYNELFLLGKPVFYILAASTFEFDNLMLDLAARNKQAIVRHLRGKKSKTVQDFFNEIAAALQFPLYFGDNWDALDECISDLEWLVGEVYILLVSDAQLLFTEADTKDFEILLNVLERAHEQWLEPNRYWPRNRLPTPFHVVFHCSRENIAKFAQRLDLLGIKHQLLIE